MELQKFTTAVDLLRWRAQNHPARTLFTFIKDAEGNAVSITYGEFDQKVRFLAAKLQSMNLKGERAIICYSSSIDYVIAFFACLYAGVIAVTAYPPRPRGDDYRLNQIGTDAQAKVVLTSQDIIDRLKKRSVFEDCQWLATDNLTDDALANEWYRPEITTDSLALLQYTSGSTSAPKGVMVSHSNMLHNAIAVKQWLEYKEEDVMISWLPLFHDMGLLGNIWQPVYSGGTCVFMAPLTFLQTPLSWLQAITKYCGYVSGAPNFAYDLCVDKIMPEERKSLDLSSLNKLYSGAEPINYETLRRFTEIYEPYSFRSDAFKPCYGMSETTLMVTGRAAGPPVFQRVKKSGLEKYDVVETSPEDPDSKVIVSCGQPWDQTVVIADTETHTSSPSNQIGEVWISGGNVARGYWQKPGITTETFQAYLKESGTGPFLRTGDLGYLKDGELYVVGRLKDLIIIRGQNYYPQDIEFRVEKSHQDLRKNSTAAFSLDVNGTEKLAIAQEIRRDHLRKLDVDEVAKAMRQIVSENHELQVYAILLLKTGSIPKTTSGKIARRACRALYLKGELNLVGTSILEDSTSDVDITLTREALRNAVPEERLKMVISYLQTLVENIVKYSPVDFQQPLVRLGIDSIATVEISHRLKDDLNVVLPQTIFLEDINGFDIARRIVEDIDLTPDIPESESFDDEEWEEGEI